MKYLPLEKIFQEMVTHPSAVKKFGERNQKYTVSIIKMYILLYIYIKS